MNDKNAILPQSGVNKISDRFRVLKSRLANLPEGVILVFAALIIGALTGVAASCLKRLVKFFNDAILWNIDLSRPNIRFLIWPLVGILITTVFQKYVVGYRIARGSRVIKIHLNNKEYRLPSFLIFDPVVGCSLTMGCGATGGTESPTALSGAAMGSVLGRWLGLDDNYLRILIGIGAGAGIAAIFKSPMGGAMFTLEVLQMQLSTVPIMAMITACLVASSSASILSGFTFDIHFTGHMPMDTSSLGWVAILGVCCGLYSIYYDYTKRRALQIFTGISNIWVGALVTGAMLSVAVFCFPLFFGEGFGMITSMVNDAPIDVTASGIFATLHGDRWIYITLGAILLLKGILVAASNGAGGVAGDFVPTFFAGCVAGYLFAIGANALFGSTLQPWYFALIGMGAVMAGTLQAPLMALFIICETTDTYLYLFPYLIAVSISYAMARIGGVVKIWRSLSGELPNSGDNMPPDQKRQ